MDKVTTKFKQYNLEEIAKEYRESCSTEQEKQVTLPHTVGGSEIHLLLSKKNTLLDPVLLKILPSGVGVYLSSFIDIYNSRIILLGHTRCSQKVTRRVGTSLAMAYLTPWRRDMRNQHGTKKSNNL